MSKARDISQGTLFDDSITMDKLNSTGTQSENVYNKTIKIWIAFKGTGAVSIYADVLVTSITDHGTGQYTLNFDESLPNTNYVVAGTAGDNTTIGVPPSSFSIRPFIRNVNSFRFGVVYANSAEYGYFDKDYVSVLILQ